MARPSPRPVSRRWPEARDLPGFQTWTSHEAVPPTFQSAGRRPESRRYGFMAGEQVRKEQGASRELWQPASVGSALQRELTSVATASSPFDGPSVHGTLCP